MAQLIAGLGISHTPSMSFNYDEGIAHGFDPKWQLWFDGVQPVKRWFEEQRPDRMVIIYNDHFNYFDFAAIPTFAIGLGTDYPFADEGFGPRDFPPIPGDPAFSSYIARELMAKEFDLTFCPALEVDHGINSWFPYLFDAPWPISIVPIAVNFVVDPAPAAERLCHLGSCLRKIIHSYDADERVVILSTGGMSHQIQGSRFGLSNQTFDRYFIDKLETDFDELKAVPVEKIQKIAGAEGAELLMWFVMRSALSDHAKTIYSYYTLPALTGCGVILMEEQSDD